MVEEETTTARQQHAKHVSMAMDMHATEELLEAVFSMQSVSRVYNKSLQAATDQTELVVRQPPASKDMSTKVFIHRVILKPKHTFFP
jgi:ribosome-interacting GTPase 1